jgi:hypothetical protein
MNMDKQDAEPRRRRFHGTIDGIGCKSITLSARFPCFCCLDVGRFREQREKIQVTVVGLNVRSWPWGGPHAQAGSFDGRKWLSTESWAAGWSLEEM